VAGGGRATDLAVVQRVCGAGQRRPAALMNR
jgi:hypothetical protein